MRSPRIAGTGDPSDVRNGFMLLGQLSTRAGQMRTSVTFNVQTFASLHSQHRRAIVANSSGTALTAYKYPAVSTIYRLHATGRAAALCWVSPHRERWFPALSLASSGMDEVKIAGGTK